jgi:diguanylate cyclase (GGDEF)-like protein
LGTTEKANPLSSESIADQAEAISVADLPNVEINLLNALPACVAVLDHTGQVLLVNDKWTVFAKESGALEREEIVGLRYLDPGFWYGNPGEETDDAIRARSGIGAVLAQELDSFVLDYQCHTPVGEHWFELRASPLPLDGGTGAIVMQVEISERKKSADRAWRRANYDHLTKLPNRSLLLDRLTQALAMARRQESCGGLILFDIDRLHEVNDLHGHEVGDELLRQCAERLVTSIRRSDSVARVGDDEFVVLLPRVSDETDLENLCEKIVAQLGQTFEIADLRLSITLNSGRISFDGSAHSAGELLSAVEVTAYNNRPEGETW